MSSTIPQLRDAVVAALASALTGVNVGIHGGTFDEAELKRYATLAPAVRVCVVGCGATKIYNDGRPYIPVNFAAVVVTKDAVTAGAKIERDLAALAMAGAIELTISGNRFGLEGVFRPEDVRARNEYSGAVDQMNIALWQVNWTSGLLVGAAAEDAVAALSQLWINGVEMGSGEEILANVQTGAPPAPFLPPIAEGAP
jgi:hypothetical protein